MNTEHAIMTWFNMNTEHEIMILTGQHEYRTQNHDLTGQHEY